MGRGQLGVAHCVYCSPVMAVEPADTTTPEVSIMLGRQPAGGLHVSSSFRPIRRHTNRTVSR
jgi:hypothetical protein